MFIALMIELFIGGCLGVTVMAVISIARESDSREDNVTENTEDEE